ncbi:SusC/RagA family TonB-linked outer membrane protein [Puteibacter caeruleilacunae]|nr:SusC/RagA family TonB-linked outer membrane protein [Puteibacter caeruleilacunae]
MKKNRIFTFWWDRYILPDNLLLKMKLTLIMTFVLLGQLLASTVQSQTTMNLKLNNVSLEKAIEEIQGSSDYFFVYNKESVNLNRNVTVNLKNSDIKSVLSALFDNTEVHYRIIDNHIVLSKVIKAEQQVEKISGTVTDEDGEPLPGVSVVVKGTTVGVVTDFDGNYSLKLPEGATIVVYSFVGMRTQEIEVNGQSVLNVVLVADAIGLEEVVAVGYGVQKKVNLTGAVESVSSDVVEDKGVTSIVEALQGRVSNFNINYSNGGIDATPNINIRGTTSLNGGGPLILIDGVPSSGDALTQMNPQDIESVSVLKDAASAAIYGGRAAFGVVLVTTKKGKNEKMKVTVNASTRMSKQTEFPEFVDTYTHVTTVNEALKNRGSSPRFKDDYVAKVKAYHEDPNNNPIDEIVNPKYDADGELIGGDYYFFGTVDYMNEVYKTSAFQQKVDVSVSGGTEKTSLYMSTGYTKDEGFYRVGNDDLNLYTMRLNAKTKVNDWFTVGGRASYIKHIYDKPYNYRDYYALNYFQRTYFPLKNRGNGHYLQHALGYLDSGARDRYEDDDINLNMNVEIKPFKGMTINGSLSYYTNIGLNKENVYKITFSDNFGYRYPITALWNASAKNSHIYHRTRQKRGVVADVYGQYIKNIADNHEIKVLVGFNQESYRYLNYSAKRRDLISESVPSLNLTLGEDYVGQSAHHWAIRGAFYRLNYSYKDKYLLEMNGRYDGTSRFQKSDRFGFFPSVSLGWRVSEESFMEDTENWLNNLKLRVSYGALGNQNVSTYAYIATMGSYKANYILGSEKPIAINNPKLVNPNLTWETVTTLDFGLDAYLFNKLGLTFDVYKRTTKDMLVAGEALPGILGTSAPTRNAADLETKGWELTASWNDKVGDFGYGIRVNISDSKAHIAKFDNNPTGALSKYRVGEELGEIWGYETEGFFKDAADAATAQKDGGHDQTFISGRAWKPGDIKYRDQNGDKKIDRGDLTIDDHGDLKVIGNTRARYNYGITTNVSWKGINLEAFFQGVGRRHFMPSGSIFFPYASAWDNLQTHQVGRWWTEDNQDAYFPQLEAYASRNFQTQSKYLQNAAYIRLKSLSLSYTVPKNIIRGLPFENVVVSFNGRNLWEKHSLPAPFDPEGGNGLQVPFRRSYSMGIKINL